MWKVCSWKSETDKSQSLPAADAAGRFFLSHIPGKCGENLCKCIDNGIFYSLFLWKCTRRGRQNEFKALQLLCLIMFTRVQYMKEVK